MKKFNLFTSNRLENLLKKLADQLRTPLESPLDKEIIIVQSKGMERWLSLELARHHGICANMRFTFPNKFVYEEIFRKILSEIPETSPYETEIMTWRIMKLLPACVEHPDFGNKFEHLKTYLEGIGKNLKQFQIAEQIADIFDQYLLFRPEMIFDWEKGKEDHWQALLWRDLINENKTKHFAALAKIFFQKIEQSFTDNKKSPARISVFGISALPGFHIQVFDAISNFMQVNLFLMNPCQEYWGDILSKREKKRITKDSGSHDLHINDGNSLLASMGTMGRDFFNILSEFDLEHEPIDDEKEPNAEYSKEKTLLNSIQSDILNLREYKIKKIIDPYDKSIQIHSCHSPMREVEVLHDRLLELFEHNTDLKPRDILVMTPNIELYAPYIQAVFDMPTNDPRRIPFSIADRGVRVESQIIDAFFNILDLIGSRFGAAQVITILETPAVYQRFDLTESDLDLIRKWVKDTRIRWGIDKKNRRQMGLPDLSENTWQAGLDRLMMGYAMPGWDESLFADILPYDFMEGSETKVLGNFFEFTDRLFSFIRLLKKKRTLAEWSKLLKERFLDNFFKADEEIEPDIRIIRETLNDLENIQKISGFNEKTDISVIKSFLHHHVEKRGDKFGFISGGVTFCIMLPMRSIPFKVICLIGMSDGEYPRQGKTLGFDLMAKYPKPGDRSRRNDDRYLFLESLLSARERLYISYVGQSIQNNSVIPPSVLISELIDYIEKNYKIPEIKISEHLVTKHRLQGFSPEYFKKKSKFVVPHLCGSSHKPHKCGNTNGGEEPPKGGTTNNSLFSYSEENCLAARTLIESRVNPRLFISKGISEPESEWKTIDLSDFCRFFRNPAQFLLNKRLGIYLDKSDSVLEEKEFFRVEGLDSYFLGQNLMEKRAEDKNIFQFLAVKKASGILPHGTVGECIYDKFCRNVESFVKKIDHYTKKDALKPFEVDLNISDFRLTGKLTGIYPERMIQYRYATVKAKDHIKIWIHHLILNCCQNGYSENGYPKTSMLAGKDSIWEYTPVEESEDILKILLEKYWYGLKKPLHFFPESSWQYAEQIRGKKDSVYALQKAGDGWRGDEYSSGEFNKDSYFQFCFSDANPLDSEFEETSIRIFEPLLKKYRQIN